MSKPPDNHNGERHGAEQHPAQPAQSQPGGQWTGPPQMRPGEHLANVAQPYAETEVPKRQDAASFLRPGHDTTHPDGYPKLKYHPVHGGVVVKDPGEESQLYPHTDWFDTAELADMARTHTEAAIVYANNQAAKLKQLDEAGHQVVRNSVQADEAIRIARAEPL